MCVNIRNVEELHFGALNNQVIYCWYMTIEHLTKDLEKNGPVSEESMKQFLAGLDFTLPADYLQFITNCNLFAETR